jgi:hypothetical protein
MSKGNTPRFTRRVRKDILGIKARSQQKQNLLRNNRGKEFDLYKKQEIPNLNLMQLIIFVKMIRYF